MISTELQGFYKRWLRKAERYQSHTLQGCFDKFFTLFVAYNRLYAELARSCMGRGTWKWNGFSDALAAKANIQKYLGSQNILQNIEYDITCKRALSSIIDLLERKVFYIKLVSFSGEHRIEADSSLLEDLKSSDPNKKVYAVLDIIYSIRCNMFHGHKGYEDIQTQLLIPVIILLKKIMDLLYEKMSRDY